jgi:8-oxo-dGTP pyrophosphatase MutT (NUDIX family)
MRGVERDVARAVVLDAAGRVLLFHTHDPTYPELGTWWELPGGGIEPGEDHRATLVRELAEEAGIRVRRDEVGAATWRRRSTFRYRGERRHYREVVAAVRIGLTAPPVDGAGRVDFENEDYFDYRWWPVGEITASAERFYPGRLPALLESFLCGTAIDEPLERWS